MRDVKRPPNSRPRERRVSQEEISSILKELDYNEGTEIKLVRHQVAVAFLLALETAMRQGEIFSLTWPNIWLDKKTAYLPDTKNGMPRQVPLSSRARMLILKQKHLSTNKVFPCQQGSAAAIFRRAVRKTGIENLTFHDTPVSYTHLTLPTICSV